MPTVDNRLWPILIETYRVLMSTIKAKDLFRFLVISFCIASFGLIFDKAHANETDMATESVKAAAVSAAITGTAARQEGSASSYGSPKGLERGIKLFLGLFGLALVSFTSFLVARFSFDRLENL